jgi:hypothetical protein
VKDWQRHQSQLFSQPGNIRFLQQQQRRTPDLPVFEAHAPTEVNTLTDMLEVLLVVSCVAGLAVVFGWLASGFFL